MVSKMGRRVGKKVKDPHLILFKLRRISSHSDPSDNEEMDVFYDWDWCSCEFDQKMRPADQQASARSSPSMDPAWNDSSFWENLDKQWTDHLRPEICDMDTDGSISFTMDISHPFNKTNLEIDANVSQCINKTDCKQALGMKTHWPYLMVHKCQTAPESKMLHEENCATRPEHMCSFDYEDACSPVFNEKCSSSAQDDCESRGLWSINN